MERGKEIVRISVIGIAVNLVLIALKGTVGAMTGSVAIIMDALNNLSDALSSVITIVGTKLAGKNPDKKHPYGYGQIEYVSSVTIAVIVLLTGLTSFKESFGKILHPQAANYTALSLAIIAVAVLAKYFLGRYVKAAGKKYNSESLVASGTDSVFDSAISLSILAAGIISIVWGVCIEGWLGAIIAVVILKAGVEILMDSLGGIIGLRIDSGLSASLKSHISQYPGVAGAYDLVLHRYGPERIIGSVHVELPDTMSAKEIHVLSRRIAEDVYTNYGIILTVGIYASNTDNAICAEIKERLLEFSSDYPEILQVHGFYVDTERKRVSFDLIVDFKCERKAELRDGLIERMKSLYPDYDFSAILDNDFSD